MTVDLCREHMEHILTSGCTKVKARLTMDTTVVNCAAAEHAVRRVAVIVAIERKGNTDFLGLKLGWIMCSSCFAWTEMGAAPVFVEQN